MCPACSPGGWRLPNLSIMSRFVSRSTVVAAPPQRVFDLLAEPGRHAELDGSGTVRGRLRGPARLSAGATFGMRMRLGLPYVIRNQVVEFEEGRRIAWRHAGHHVWRYELEPVGEGTRVTETFDWEPARAPRLLELTGFPARNAAAMERTLARLPDLLAAQP